MKHRKKHQNQNLNQNQMKNLYLKIKKIYTTDIPDLEREESAAESRRKRDPD